MCKGRTHSVCLLKAGEKKKSAFHASSVTTDLCHFSAPSKDDSYFHSRRVELVHATVVPIQKEKLRTEQVFTAVPWRRQDYIGFGFRPKRSLVTAPPDALPTHLQTRSDNSCMSKQETY